MKQGYVSDHRGNFFHLLFRNLKGTLFLYDYKPEIHLNPNCAIEVKKVIRVSILSRPVRHILAKANIHVFIICFLWSLFKLHSYASLCVQRLAGDCYYTWGRQRNVKLGNLLQCSRALLPLCICSEGRWSEESRSRDCLQSICSSNPVVGLFLDQ